MAQVDPYELYAIGLCCLAQCDPNNGIGASRLAEGLGIALTDEDPYSGAVQAGLLVREGVTTIWTQGHLSADRRRVLQMRVFAQWYLQRLGLRGSTASEAAIHVGAALACPSAAMCDLWRQVDSDVLCELVETYLRSDAPTALAVARCKSSFPPTERETQPPGEIDVGPVSGLVRTFVFAR